MKIEDLIFTDAIIISYNCFLDVVDVEFRDYANRRFKITFRGNVSYTNNDGIRVNITNSKINDREDQSVLSLMDDEKTCIFQVVYDEYEIEVISD